MRGAREAIGSFVYGITLPWHALRLIVSRPRLLAWSLVPVAITVALYGWLVTTLDTAAKNGVIAFFTSHGWNTQGWGAWTLLALTQLALVILGAITFSFVATIFASPFNDILAESTERFVDPRLPDVPAATWRIRLRLIRIDAAKTVISTLALLIALVISWVPLLNFIALVAAALLVTFQYTSYPQTRRGVGLWPGLAFLGRHWIACTGFGLALTFLFAIPLVASFVLPTAVVGGTLLVSRAQATPRLR